MRHIVIESNITHQELFQLLPWYVNKTLQGAELKAVEDHLSVCLVCKRELIQLQKLAQAVIQEGAVETAEQASFSRLKKRLHSNMTTEQVGNVSQITQAKTQKRAKYVIPRPALAMAAALLLSLLIPRYVEVDLKHGSDFRTLSSDKQQATVAKNEIRVVFAEAINQQEKDSILERIHGQIIVQPTAQGVYTVQLNQDIADKQLLDIVESLRKDANVIFAEPAYALLSSTRVENK